MNKPKYLTKKKGCKNLPLSSTVNSYKIKYILLFSVIFNILAFLVVIALYPPCWYTNDDYRMMTIASGAYTGTPSADVVFMRYPIGLLLSGLYNITTQIPWYGLFTMLCMFVPSCIFCYYIVKKAYLKNHAVLGVVIYILLFMFLIVKYICLPQFTLTSAFMGVGAIALLLEMPAQKNIVHIILAVMCAVLSFSIRSKAFYLLLPLIALVVIVRIINEKGTKIWKPFVSVFIVASFLCGIVYTVDYMAWNRTEDYQQFREFNIARSSVYDYGNIPSFYDNMSFYVSNGISEATYRALSARYLDLDSSVDTETMETIGDYIEEIRINSGSFFERLITACKKNIEYWFNSEDKYMKYSSIFVFVLLGIVLIYSLKKKKPNIIFPLAVAGLMFESLYLKFSGRLLVRIVDMLLLALGVVGCLAFVNMLEVRKKTFREYCSSVLPNKADVVAVCLVTLSVVAVSFSVTMSMNTALKERYFSVSVTQSDRLRSLESYSKLHPDSFFFYDSNDFIASTDYVFKTYDDGEILNFDSPGSWNVGSQTYYERNSRFGFTTMADALTNDDCNAYFVATSPIKTGMTKNLKDKYNKKLTLVDTVQSDCFILHIYMVVDDD